MYQRHTLQSPVGRQRIPTRVVTSTFSSCDQLAQLSVQGWSYDKLMSREKLCHDALKAKGISTYFSDKTKSPPDQLRPLP